MLKRLFLVLAIPLYALPGCSVTNGEEQTMYELASALTKLTAAVESAVRYKNADPNLQDQALLEFATRHDRHLLHPFDGYQLRARADGRHGITMVCTPEGYRALLEDAGCTARLDRHVWQEPSPQPCRIMLSASRVCPSR